MSLRALMDRRAELRGMFARTFACVVEIDGIQVDVVVECEKPCVDISNPFIQKLIVSQDPGLAAFLTAVSNKALEQEALWLLEMSSPQVTAAPPPTVPRVGWVYLLRAENGRYKIGRTGNLESRIRQLHTASPIHFNLTHSFRTFYSRQAEGLLHERFAHTRTHGEWFELTREHVSQIRGIPDFGLDGEIPVEIPQ